VQAAVDRDFGEVEPDDPIERCFGLSTQLVEHAGRDPLVAAGPQRRIGHLEVHDRFDVDPRRSGHQPDQDPPETQPVRDPWSVAAERVLAWFREQRFDGRENGVHHFGLECAHDVG